MVWDRTGLVLVHKRLEGATISSTTRVVRLTPPKIRLPPDPLNVKAPAAPTRIRMVCDVVAAGTIAETAGASQVRCRQSLTLLQIRLCLKFREQLVCVPSA
ncbi:hypothetical protein IVB36_01215 [Bradyrhizobium sp. 35]|nr:hypothetical protein [Bradyrhizobium sp. 35]